MSALGADDPVIVTEELVLTPLAVDDAAEMVKVLDDDRLHEFIGGHPASLDELRDRYRRLVAGPGEPGKLWLNWIVRHQRDEVAVGTVQATITESPGGPAAATVAWVIGAPWQGRGFASQAAPSVVEWLRAHGVEDINAHIHPDHRASAVVAGRAGLHATDERRDGEIVWRRTRAGDAPERSSSRGDL